MATPAPCSADVVSPISVAERREDLVRNGSGGLGHVVDGDGRADEFGGGTGCHSHAVGKSVMSTVMRSIDTRPTIGATSPSNATWPRPDCERKNPSP